MTGVVDHTTEHGSMQTYQGAAHSAAQSDVGRRVLVAVLLVAILAVGAALRFTGRDWDDGMLLHPDERFLSWVAADLETPASLGVYFDTTTSTMNPNNVGPPHSFFVYGTIPVFIGHFAGEITSNTSLYSIYLPGRAMAALADMLTILMVFLIARRLFDWRAGLLASALYAVAALPVQLSHFYTVDPFTTAFAMAAFWFAARVLVEHHWLDYVLFGLALGLAMASKVSIAPLAMVLILAIGIRIARQAYDEQISNTVLRRVVMQGMIGLVIAGAVTVLVFRVGQPYAFLPPNSGVEIDAEQLDPAMAALSRVLDPTGFRFNPDWLRQMREIRGQVSGLADIPPNHQWAQRTPLVFPWVNMVRVGLGWPLGLFVWFAFLWAIWEMVRRSRGWWRLVLPVVWTAFLFLWQGTAWVKTMRYFLPIYPTLLILGGWAIIALWDRVSALVAARHAPRWHWSRVAALTLSAAVLIAGLAWSFAVTRIYTRTHTRIAATNWIKENIPGDVTLVFDTPEGTRRVQLGLSNDWPVLFTGEEDPAQPNLQYTYLNEGTTRSIPFEMPFDGTLTDVYFNHIRDPLQFGDEHQLDLALTAINGDEASLAEATLSGTFSGSEDPRGDSYTLSVNPVEMREGGFYQVLLTPDAAGPLVLAGDTIATEGEWDDSVPLGYDVWGTLYQPFGFNMSWPDNETKRLRMQYILDNSDILTISSNRFYDSLRRNPQRWPMTMAYYEALFSGDLGFELIGDFTSPPTLGPITFNDQGAEEAWTVYDHPRVFVFQKTDAYSSARTAEVLNSVDLTTVQNAIAPDAPGEPIDLPVPAPRPYTEPVKATAATDTVIAETAVNTSRSSLFATAQPLGVIIWWLAASIIGWAAFPLLWTLLPGLPDRGYPIARTVGLLFVAWLAWLLASIDALPWAWDTIFLSLVVLLLISAALGLRRREAIWLWVKENTRHILIVEAGMAVMFLAFVLIRAGNPDLWHPFFGGEKPMDFAYLNAVLKTDSFPPYNPWFAGHTINYYYFGFVIAAVPIKLLGVPPAIAYNLMLPTLYALTGGAAFSAAFNLSAPRTDRLDGVRWKPYAAGLAALMLAVVLGNLDEIRTLLWGFAELGYGSPEWTFKLVPSLQQTLRGIRLWSQGATLPIAPGDWYWNATRVIPVPLTTDGMIMEQQPITEFPIFTFLYADLHAHMVAMPLTLSALNWSIGLVRGAADRTEEASHAALPHWLRLVLTGLLGALIIGALRPTNTWDYPTYLALGAVAILFAVYARHEVQTALPVLAVAGLTAAALGGLFFLFSEGSTIALPLTAVGAGIGLLLGYGIGLALLRPEGSGLDHWLALLTGGVLAALLTGATILMYRPYIRSYELTYTTFNLWAGSSTALWAYIDIFGLFFFIIGSWLVWEVWGWLKGHITRRHTMAVLLIGGGLLGATVLAATQFSPIMAVALPMLAGALALFMRDGQTLEKRFVLLMLILALALTVLVETVVLTGDLDRMNTVFKFYLQVWMLLAIVGGAALGWLIPALRRTSETRQTVWGGALAVLVALASLYPLMATRAKISDRWNPNAPATLDGMAYMPTVQRIENGRVFNLDGDYEAIRWLQNNVQGKPVIVEGLTTEYLWGSRISVYTGLPAVVGWNWHERQQNGALANEVWQRVIEVNQFYNTVDTTYAMSFLDHYDVELIVVGGLERAMYDPAGIAKFNQMADTGLLDVVYSRDDTIIYRVAAQSTGAS